MHLTTRGLLLLLLTAPILALSTWLPLLAWLALAYFVLVLLVLGLDYYQAQPVSRFEVTRSHDNRLSLGAENLIQVVVRNRAFRTAVFWVRDEPPEAFEIGQRILTGAALPRQTWTGSYHVRPRRRGDYEFGDTTLRWLGPLGLVVRQGKVKTAVSVKVYPNLIDVRRYDLMLRRNRLQELGLRSARQFGEGTEFERLREYTPDDEYRRINWKATARRHRPITVEYQTERSQNVIAVLDCGRMMQSPVQQMAKLDYAVNAVLLLSYVASGKGDKVGMMSFAADVDRFLAPKQGRGQFYRMLEMLYAVDAQPVEPDYGRALTYLAHKQRKRSLILIFTDISGGAGLSSLIESVTPLARRSLPLVVTISDPDIVAASHQIPGDSAAVYQRAAAAQLLDERQLTLEQLSRRGVLTLDVPANQLSLAVINRYLALKARSQL